MFDSPKYKHLFFISLAINVILLLALLGILISQDSKEKDYKDSIEINDEVYCVYSEEYYYGISKGKFVELLYYNLTDSYSYVVIQEGKEGNYIVYAEYISKSYEDAYQWLKDHS